ncbi:MAG: tetratricopeptide repeat protein [Acidobacteriota bacterium]
MLREVFRQTIATWFLVGACVAPWCCAMGGQARSGRAARGSRTAFYDHAAYARGRSLWAKGDLGGAARAFAAMVQTSAGAETWTWSIALLCETHSVAGMRDAVRAPSPIFISSMTFQGRTCYRLCAGLAPSRAALLRQGRPRPKDPALRPFPVRLAAFAAGPPPAAAGASLDSSGASPPTSSPEEVPLQKPSPVEQSPSNGVKAGQGLVAASGEAAGRSANAGAEAAPRRGAVHQPEGEVWFQKGLQAYQNGRRSEADEDFERALAADPERPEVLNNLGILRLEEKRYAEAEALFRKALAVDPEYARAHLNLAGALWGQKKQAEAVAEARKAAELDPSDVHAHLSLASFYLALGQRPEAETEAKRVLLLDPGNMQAKAFLAGVPSP